MSQQSIPKYLQEKLVKYDAQRKGQRSASNYYMRLKIPFTKDKTFVGRSFSVMAPTWWNNYQIMSSKLYPVTLLNANSRHFYFLNSRFNLTSINFIIVVSYFYYILYIYILFFTYTFSFYM